MAIKGRVFFLKNESRRFQGNFFAQLLAVKLETKSNKEERRGRVFVGSYFLSGVSFDEDKETKKFFFCKCRFFNLLGTTPVSAVFCFIKNVFCPYLQYS